MKTRTSDKTVTFRRPFVLAGLDELLPAGDYSVETEEELVEGISYAVFRRTSTLLLLHAEAGLPHLARALTIDPAELEAALERDSAHDEVHDLAPGEKPGDALPDWGAALPAPTATGAEPVAHSVWGAALRKRL